MTTDSHPLQPPGILVSSTFYDLKQQRENLRRFVQDELGYRPLLSEHPSFPINPDVSTIENCRERVTRDADSLVLVVGRRYGSIDDRSAKSVTNLEYLAARQKGIPIHAFVERGILDMVAVWRSNPATDFTGQVDTPLLFEFIEEIRSSDRVWMQEFDLAQDIIDALRIQFAYQHRDGLLLAWRLRALGEAPWLEDLRGETLRIVLERPFGWEYRLFASSLRDALRSHHRLRRRHRSGVPLGLGEDVPDPLPWVQARFVDATRLGKAVDFLVNSTLQDALRPPGTPGDPEAILFVTESLGGLYRDAMQWSERLRTVNTHRCFVVLLQTVGSMLDSFVVQLEEFSAQIIEALAHVLPAAQRGENEAIELTLTLSVAPEVMQRFQREIAAAAECLKRGQ